MTRNLGLRLRLTIAVVLSGAAAYAGATHFGTAHVSWYSMDGGGGSSTGSGYLLTGTIGQPDGNAFMVGSGFEFTGGFWAFGDDLLGEMWCESAALLPAAAAAGDQFGFGVDIDGAWAAAGSILDDDIGSVTVFMRDGSGGWMEFQALAPSDGQLGDVFGVSVALDGEVMVVGAYFDDDAAVNAGAAYVFRYDHDELMWLEEQKLVPADGGAGDQFGLSVDVDGDLCVVGAGFHAGTGAGYVYEFDGATWSLRAKLTIGAEPGDEFATSVAIRDGFVALGAPRDDVVDPDDGDCDCGAVHTFLFYEDGDSEPDVILGPDDGACGDAYGTSIALGPGDLLAGGAPFASGGVGAVFLLERGDDTWPAIGWLDPETALGGDQYGHDVAIAGSRIVVGARGDASIAGYAETWLRSGTAWRRDAVLTASDAETGSSFGRAVGLDGAAAIVGAPDHDGVIGSSAGAAYVFERFGDLDCDGNGTPDACEVAQGTIEDCNGNGVPDMCDIDSGASADEDGNGVPDECEHDPCPTDVDDDGEVGFGDLVSVLAAWGACAGCPEDVDGDGDVGFTDLVTLLAAWGPCS